MSLDDLNASLEELRRVPSPQISPLDTLLGGLKLAWSYSSFYAEIDLRNDGTFEWFFRDRLLDTHCGSEEPMAGRLPLVLLQNLFRCFTRDTQENLWSEKK